MAEIDEKVMAFVEETLKKSPRMKLDELFEKAKAVSASIGELSKRQFNARYPLQAKRRKAQASRSKAPAKAKPGKDKKEKKPAPTGPRGRSAGARKVPSSPATAADGVRQVFLQFAVDIAGAEERKELVKVLANVDRYVDRVVKVLK